MAEQEILPPLPRAIRQGARGPDFRRYALQHQTIHDPYPPRMHPIVAGMVGFAFGVLVTGMLFAGLSLHQQSKPATIGQLMERWQ